jgi:toxin ParE1/3/4
LGRSRAKIVAGMRSFPVGSYLIFYRVQTPTEVEIVRVVHGARNVKKLRF